MIYTPDEQDEIVSDALAVGGPAFARELHFDATAAADAVVPWDGVGGEPPERRAAWLAAAWVLVEQRRVDLGLSGAVRAHIVAGGGRSAV